MNKFGDTNVDGRLSFGDETQENGIQKGDSVSEPIEIYHDGERVASALHVPEEAYGFEFNAFRSGAFSFVGHSQIRMSFMSLSGLDPAYDDVVTLATLTAEAPQEIVPLHHWGEDGIWMTGDILDDGAWRLGGSNETDFVLSRLESETWEPCLHVDQDKNTHVENDLAVGGALRIGDSWRMRQDSNDDLVTEYWDGTEWIEAAKTEVPST